MKKMTATKTQTPAEQPNVSMYRHTRADYAPLQSARRLAKLEKLKAAEYTRADGIQDMRITYSLNNKTCEAQNLDEWGHVIAEKLASLIEQWTPNESVYRLIEILSAMKFCDPAVEVDLTKLISGRIPAKLKTIVTIADNAGWGLNQRGEIVELTELLTSITQAEKLGMVFPG
jgi:hypothetical protein